MNVKLPVRKRDLRLSKSTGFTLVEVIVSLTLAMLITALIFGGFEFGRRSWETGRSKEAVQSDFTVSQALAALMEKAVPINSGTNRQAPTILFSGYPDKVTFVALSEGETRLAGLIVVEIGSSSGPAREDRRLYATTATFRPGRDTLALASTSTTVTLKRNAKVQLAYFGSIGREAQSSWHNEWLNQDQLPQLISFQMISDNPRTKLEFPVTVQLRNQKAIVEN